MACSSRKGKARGEVFLSTRIPPTGEVSNDTESESRVRVRSESGQGPSRDGIMLLLTMMVVVSNTNPSHELTGSSLIVFLVHEDQRVVHPFLTPPLLCSPLLCSAQLCSVRAYVVRSWVDQDFSRLFVHTVSAAVPHDVHMQVAFSAVTCSTTTQQSTATGMSAFSTGGIRFQRVTGGGGRQGKGKARQGKVR